ncbi:hypothetical protein J108_22665 [Mycobacteroides abscessus subsp. bolletii CRM-0020]|uniref:Uncharacterized protein n=2 Tax=Mycobacteroides abscessus TaxID=36809 RepID=A0A829HPJ8_9MYCO|nr:hypothetical protein MYCMA_03085 [Mycobacteroides abscessus subsp. massiliense str. GO 06]AMU28407.1 hypothetical protein A3N96_25750 [Mycobacteroides abscessus]EPQ21225.1 hypothetical protein J108_22665 [Mycobacteroides abscessus subsp. bolletii CRM-0020]SKT77669.1 Uncharacterised protein [Mycobacteroides abscessus subsp. massiliense]AMU38036.1 hypothetical protein A3N98_24630 [Mycobacteroides abscessus]
MPRRRLPDHGAVGFLKLRPLAEGLQEMMLAAQGLQIGASGGATRSPGHGVIDIGAVGDGVATGEPAQLVAGTYEGGKLGGGAVSGAT